MLREQKKLVKQKPETTPLLELVLTALEATWRIPEEKPLTTLPSHFDRDALCAFTIDQVDGGHVANIKFDVAPGEANLIGTSDTSPLPTHRDAFLAGAMIVCEVVSGSRELPFIVTENELLVATVTSHGKPMIMRRPFPTQRA